MISFDIVTANKKMSEISWKTALAKPAYTRALAGISLYFGYADTGDMIILQQIVPGWLYVSLVTAMASYFTKIVDELVLPKIPNNPYSSYEGMIIAPVACGVADYLTIAATSTVAVPWKEPFILGAGAQIVSNITWDNYVAPMIGN